MLEPAIAVLLAAVPATFAWWSGRRLARATDDPALPEMLLARQQRVQQAMALSIALLIVFLHWHALWALPLLLAGLTLAARPLRRALFDERIGAVAQLAHGARAVVSGVGFWLALAFAPAIVLAIPEPQRGWGAPLLAALLLLWESQWGRLWKWAHRARPLDRPELAARLDAVVRRARTRPPELLAFGAPGHHFVNALAMPDVRRPAVLFSHGLLEALPADEIVAILGHELAHLEHFTPRRTWLLRGVNIALVALGVGLPLVAGAQAPWTRIAFPLLCTVALLARGVRSKTHETASDRRAVELTGDADALARALTRLHALARLPRRWPHELERAASHPSLARRIRDIREIAMVHGFASAVAAARDDDAATPAAPHTPHAMAPTPDDAPLPALLRSTTPGCWVILEAERAVWLEGVPVDTAPVPEALRAAAVRMNAVAYGELAELRIAASGAHRVLVSTTTTGTTRRTPLAREDVARAQAALDLVDGQLGALASDRTPLIGRLVALTLLLVAVASGTVGTALAVAAIVALIRPSRGALAAAGTVALAHGLATLALTPAGAGAPRHLVALYFVAAAATLVTAGLRRAERDAEATWPERLEIAPLAVVAVIAWALAWPVLSTEGRDALAWSPAALAGAVSLCGVGAWLLVRHAWAARAAGLVLLAAGAAALLGARDAAQRTRETMVWRERSARLVSRTAFPNGATRLDVSPSGRRWVVQRQVMRGVPVAAELSDGWDFELGTFGAGRDTGAAAQPRVLRALQVAFLDDARLVALVRRGDSLAVRLEPTFAGEDPLPRSQVALPPLLAPTLQVDRATGRWAVLGQSMRRFQGAATTSGAESDTGGSFAEEDESADVAEMAAAMERLRAEAAVRRDTIVMISGRVGDDSVSVRRWVVPGFGRALAALRDGSLLYWTSEIPRGTGGLLATYVGIVGGGTGLKVTLWRIGATGPAVRVSETSGLTGCGSPDERGELLCVARERSLLRLWRFDSTGHGAEVGTLRTGLAAMNVPEGLTHVVLPFEGDQRVAIVDARRRVVTRLRGVETLSERGVIMDVHTTPTGVVALRRGGGARTGAELLEYQIAY